MKDESEEMDGEKTKGIGNDWLWVSLITFLGLVLRLYRLGEQSLWFDEGYSWYMASLPLGPGFETLRATFVHPPLHHLLCLVWVRLGSNEAMLRLPGALIGVVTIPVFYYLGRRLEGRALGLLVALLLAVNPFHVWYSRDARNYALLALWTLPVWMDFLRLLDRKQVWFRFTLSSGILYFTHYFGLLVPLAQSLYLIFHLRRYRLLFRRWVLAQAIAFLPLFGWLILLFTQQVKAIGIGWIPRPAFWAPLITLWNFAAIYTGALDSFIVVVTLLLFAIALGMFFKTKFPPKSVLLLWLLAPPAAIIIISWSTGRNLYIDRYFIGGLPALLLCVGWGALELARRRPAAGVSLALLLVAASFANTTRIYTDPALRKVDWRGAVSYVKARAAPGDLVILPRLEHSVLMVYYDGTLEWDYMISYVGQKGLVSIAAEREQVWLILNNPHHSNHLLTNPGSFDVYTELDPAVVEWLAVHRPGITDEQHFAGLTVLQVQLGPE